MYSGQPVQPISIPVKIKPNLPLWTKWSRTYTHLQWHLSQNELQWLAEKSSIYRNHTLVLSENCLTGEGQPTESGMAYISFGVISPKKITEPGVCFTTGWTLVAIKLRNICRITKAISEKGEAQQVGSLHSKYKEKCRKQDIDLYCISVDLKNTVNTGSREGLRTLLLDAPTSLL